MDLDRYYELRTILQQWKTRLAESIRRRIEASERLLARLRKLYAGRASGATPEYRSSDFSDGTAWRLRGKFNIPRERFIHYAAFDHTQRGANADAPEGGGPWFGWADLVRQPSTRVRAAVIAVLLSHPHYAEAIPAALERLPPMERQTLLLFYTAAVLLQQQYAARLQQHVTWQPLPDRFTVNLGLPSTVTIREKLAALGRRHRQQTGKVVNWAGTYENVVRCLLRSWELEAQWNR